MTRDLNTSNERATERSRTVAAVVAALRDAGTVYVPEGCPAATDDAESPAVCVDPPTLRYLVGLASEYRLRGGFRLAYPLLESDPEVDQLVGGRVLGVFLSAPF